MTDATKYGVERKGDNLILNNNPPAVTEDYVEDNEDKIAKEIMPDPEAVNDKN